MGLVDQVGERIEAGGEAGVFGARLKAARVEGIATAAYLDEQGVDVGAAGIGEEAVYLIWRLEAVAVGVNPEATKLGRGAVRGDRDASNRSVARRPGRKARCWRSG